MRFSLVFLAIFTAAAQAQPEWFHSKNATEAKMVFHAAVEFDSKLDAQEVIETQVQHLFGTMLQSEPKGVPKEIATQYETAIKKVWDSAEFKDFMNRRGFDMIYQGSADFAAFMKADNEDNQ